MKRIIYGIAAIALILLNLQSCNFSKKELTGHSNPVIGSIERISPKLNAIVASNAQIEVLGEGMVWSEGPLWLEEKGWLLFSDVKENRIHRWSEEKGLEIYLEPSGFTGDSTDSRERGSNGLTLDPLGRLVMCQHGNRQIARMLSDLENPSAEFEVLADSFQGLRLNSPNDLVYDSQGNLYFTDPPFGLSEAILDDPKKELPYQGVFRLDREGNLSLLTSELQFPNGLALSPDESRLYITNTDGENAGWYSFNLNKDGTLGKAQLIGSATVAIGKEVGYPDGIKVDKEGNIFTAGPGGLWIFSPDFELLGKIRPDKWVSNCTFDTAGETLFITADDVILRVKLKP